MDLSDKVEKAKKFADTLSTCIQAEYKASLWNYCFQSELKKIVKDDLTYNNPDSLFEQYREYFKTKSFPMKIIDTDTIFYRGRIGNEVIWGTEDNYKKRFILPYYQQEIKAPPSIYTNGGRFNRQGISYLYLADTIETCLAEVHLQIGQNCSIGEFKCREQIELIDLTKFNNDVEIKTWLEILTQPVHDGTKHIYNITRFLSDIFKSINNSGIYFESVQAAGHNIVCFKPSLFQLVEYSEKIYTATKIKYIYQQVEDSIREYSTKNNGKHIDFYDAYESKEKKKKFEYLNNWIENERLKQAAEDSITMAANSFFT